MPSVVAWVVLPAATVWGTLAPQATRRGSRSLKLAAWLLLSFAAVVLGALFCAIVRHWR